MKYTIPKADLFIKNRKKVAKELAPNSIAIFHANDIQPTNSDGTRPFKQNSDIFYLTSVDQEDTILVLYPDAQKAEFKEMLFIKKTSDLIAIWEGAKITQDEATLQSGIQSVFWFEDFWKMLGQVIYQADNIYLNLNEHLRNSNQVESQDARMLKVYQEKFPLHSYKRVAPIMHYVRSIKEPEEIEMMRKACEITGKAFERVLKFTKPGVMEYEVEAEIQHEFLRNRSRGPAYEMILGSGRNACVLHYIENDKECKDGDVMLMDFGAEYGNYCSDLSRSIPVNGKFTKRQREVYDSVLHVQRESMKLLKPGVYLEDYHKQVGILMQEELLKLGLLTKSDIQNEDPKWPAYKKYFMHGTSHFIGLDVHDVGLWHKPIEENMVFTVEPGIYILEENLGIRLENDIVITKNGYDDLMGHIPIEADEIESIMNA